jgi:hypothetical protein
LGADPSSPAGTAVLEALGNNVTEPKSTTAVGTGHEASVPTLTVVANQSLGLMAGQRKASSDG